MKQQRKNKTNQAITWPRSIYFTIKDVVNLNPQMLTASKLDITIRVRIMNEIERGNVVEIGSIHQDKGRPTKVFAFTPVTQITIDKAKSEQITLVDNHKNLIKVTSVTSAKTPTTVTPKIVNTSAVTK